MSKQYPILDRIKEANPLYGPGNAPMCRRCLEHLKHDVDHKIADKVESMSFPSDIMDDELRDLFKLRRGQHE